MNYSYTLETADAACDMPFPCAVQPGPRCMSAQAKSLGAHFAYQQIAGAIEGQILRGDLKPGDQLPCESELALMYGVTRSTLREGLRQLESDGFVHRPSPRRLEVAVPQADQLTTRAGRAMALMKVTYRELTEVTLMTEPLAARLAAQHGTQDEIAALQDLHAGLVAAEGQMALTIDLDEQFHSRIAAMGRNRVLVIAREPIALLLFRGFAQIAPFAPKFYKRQIEAHSNVIGALRDRDGERAEKWARMHIEDFWRGAQIAGLEDRIALSAGALS